MDILDLFQKNEKLLVYIVVFAIIFLPSFIKLFVRGASGQRGNSPLARQRRVSQSGMSNDVMPSNDTGKSPILSSSNRYRSNPMFPSSGSPAKLDPRSFKEK